MSEPFQPNEGDTVEFYNSEAELWEPGTVSSYAADRRLYFVEPDEESQSGWLVNHSNIRPLADATPVEAPSFWEAAKTFCRTARVSCDLANALQAQIDAFPLSTGSLIGDKVAARIAEHRERGDHYKVQAFEATQRAEKAEADLAQCRKALHDAIAEAAKVEKARDAAEARIEELEDQNRRLKTVLDLSNEDVTHYRQRVGKLSADLIEARKVAGDCEARAEKAEAQLRKSVDQSNTHSGHLNDALRNERARADKLVRQLADKVERAEKAEARVEREAHRAEELEYERDSWKNRAEITHLQHVAANKRAKDEESRGDRLADMLNTTIDERDAMTRRAISAEDRAEELEHERDELRKEWLAAEERVFELGNELAELKKALATLAGAEVVGSELP